MIQAPPSMPMAEGVKVGYRIETQMCCIVGDSDCWNVGPDQVIPVQARARVYADTGQRVLGDDDLYNRARGGSYGSFSMEDSYTAGACWMVESAPDVGLGNNGQQGVTAVAPALMYWDAVLTGSSDERREGQDPWIGPCAGLGCF